METTLDEARDWLRERVDKGAKCPCCRQHAKIYKRPLNGTMVRVLALLYSFDGKWVHVARACRNRKIPQQGDAGKLAYWNLVEAKPEHRDDSGHAGFWRITERGQRFLRGEFLVPKYVHVYDDEVLRYSGPAVSVTEVEPEFRLDELMRR